LRFGEWLNREGILGPLFVTPALLLLLVLVAYPFCMALYFSLSDAFIGRPSQFIGIRNFVNLWQSDAFRQTFQNAFVFTGAAVAFKLVLGIALALLLQQQLWFKRMIRGAVLLPWVIPTALSTLGWWWMFDPTHSAFNWMLQAMGFQEIAWLSDPYWARFSVILVNVWYGAPFFLIMYLAALKSVPEQLYEAAAIDGASAWQKFLHITLPMMRNIMAITILFSLIVTFANFDIVRIITAGGPIDRTHVFATWAFWLGIQGNDIPLGATVSLFMVPILTVVAVFILRDIHRRGNEA
jgi:multiple sugar transport system permease protein